MDYIELKTIFDRIETKTKEAERLNGLKLKVDERTDKGLVEIIFEGNQIKVDPTEFKKLLDKNLLSTDTSADFAELKLKAK